MSYRLADDVAWVTDASGSVQLTRLTTGDARLLGGAAAILFGDLVAGGDPVEAAARRWPQNPKAGHTARQLLEELAAAGYLQPAARRAVAAPLPEVEPLETPAAHSGPYTVLFVCTANICRSAYAEAYASTHRLRDVEFRSAGTQALVGRPMDPPMAAQLPANFRGAHRAEQLTRDGAREADLILTMSDEHRSYILEEWPRLASRTFLLGHAARELGNRTPRPERAELAAHLWHHRSVQPDDVVADPYRRGDAAAAECAATIRRHVDAVVSALTTTTSR